MFVDDLDAPVLAAGDTQHLERVLRLRPGEPVRLADGRGGSRPGTWNGSGIVVPEGVAVREPPPAPAVTVALAVVKGDRTEWAVQKLTEVGVDRIVPMVTERTVVRWSPDRAARAATRLRAVARAAAAQSRRAWLPEVDEVGTFAEVVAAAGSAAALADFGGGPPALERPWVLVGPEGGWGPDEAGAGVPAMSLGTTVLRAETAAVAAGMMLCALRAGLVRPANHF